jgi:nucleotide-binding universal stress UspA family protein
MSYKTILVHLESFDQAHGLLEAAALLTKKYEAHLIGLYVIPGIQVYPPAGMIIPVEVLASQKEFYLKEAEKIQKLFDTLADREGISSEWRLAGSTVPSIANVVVENAQMADLIIVGQADESTDYAAAYDAPGEVMMDSGRPVLLIPKEGSFKTIGENILVGWNGTREAARATFDALPFLKSSREVNLHWANPTISGDKNAQVLGAELATTLARHDVIVTAETSVNPDISDGDELLYYVSQRGSDLLVMGGYGHSRTREFIFGGTTKHILRHMTVPVLMSH